MISLYLVNKDGSVWHYTFIYKHDVYIECIHPIIMAAIQVQLLQEIHGYKLLTNIPFPLLLGTLYDYYVCVLLLWLLGRAFNFTRTWDVQCTYHEHPQFFSMHSLDYFKWRGVMRNRKCGSEITATYCVYCSIELEQKYPIYILTSEFS